MEINLVFFHENAEIKTMKQLFLKSVVELTNSCWTVLLSELTFGIQMCHLMMKLFGMQNQVFFGLYGIRSF